MNRIIVWIVYIIVAYIPIKLLGLEIVISYIRSFLGIIVIISFCKVAKSNSYVQFVGANTLTYFALHGKLYAMIEFVLRKIAEEFYTVCLGNEFLSSFLAIIITVIMSIILIIPAKIINKWFPWMLGRKI